MLQKEKLVRKIILLHKMSVLFVVKNAQEKGMKKINKLTKNTMRELREIFYTQL